MFKTFEKCDFVTISVALRREVLLRNEKSDSVTISVVTSIKSFRRLCRHFSRHDPVALLDGLCPSLIAARSRRTSQMLCALPSASPTLLAGFACSSRRTSSVTSRGFIPPHFSNVFRLLVGSADTSRRLCRLFSQALPALPAASFRRTSQMFFAFSSALPTLPAGSACKLSPLLARAKISSLSSPSVRLPPAEPAKSPSTFGSREFLSSVLLLR